MSDNYTEYGGNKDLFQDDDGDGLGLNTWVGIIAGVLSGLSMLTIASVYLSQKFCAPNREDTESMFLKRKLQMEQKKLATSKCTFPSIQHPSCTSILQQEENDIADEVKEIYSKISNDISKPIVCCPEKKTLYCYNPKVPSSITSSDSESKIKFSQRKIMIDKVIQSINKNLVGQENLDTLSVHEIASAALRKIAKSQFDRRSLSPSPRHEGSYGSEAIQFISSPEGRKFVESIESKRRVYEELEHEECNERVKERVKERHKEKSSSRNLFTESEIHNADNIKSLFFEKWMRQAGESDDASDESVHKDISISYDDVDSVLTSISRMDAKRLKKLKDTRFYKKMISGMDPIKSESMPTIDNQSDEEHSIVYEHDNFTKRHSIDTITEHDLFLTQEEMNYMAVNKDAIAKGDAENTRQPKCAILSTQNTQNKDAILNGKLKPLTAVSDDEGHVKKFKNVTDERSETTLFKFVRPSNYPEKTNVVQEEDIATRQCSSSCSDVASVVPSTTEENYYNEETSEIPKSRGRYDVSCPLSKEPCQLTDWSQTKSGIERSSLSQQLYESDYTKTNKDDSCYSSGIHKGCCTASSCSCSNKTTTWGEIAFKEKEKYKIVEKRLFPELVEEINEKELSASDVYYVISNNNCFMLPVSDERNVCSESDCTPTSYYLSEVRRSSDFPSGRHTT